jgi:hypothetical protein
MRYKTLSSRGMLKAFVLFAGIVAVMSLGTVGSAQATSVGLDLGSAPQITSKVANSFDALNGTALQGQTLSLDFTFSHGEFVRLFTITSPFFDVLLSLQTNGSGPLDFLQGSGYLIDSQGNAIPGFGVTGSASGNNLLGIGLFPLLKDINGTPNNDLPRPLDFSGVHFDLTFPDVGNPSVQVTGGQFELVSNPDEVFGIGPGIPRDIVPDSGSTLFLLALGSVVPVLTTRMRLTQAVKGDR